MPINARTSLSPTGENEIRLTSGLQLKLGAFTSDHDYSDRLPTLTKHEYSAGLVNSMEQIESLLTDFLEEIKLNYVQSLSQEDVEDILEQTRALRQSAKTTEY
ncbi:flavoprotein [Aphanothece sacrum FPU1]|uniref:Flavoprotein n=1 Tax=Aphanothece sacrum FPU1 TaxID=1920663 RepID=A0A401IBJ6_APHSA|nr:flavoprotein [Aphanothece sacrum FPU1]GBF84936.1 flavoprotein [Aphanothece sacrum FPU3]